MERNSPSPLVQLRLGSEGATSAKQHNSASLTVLTDLDYYAFVDK